jgi:hypothetical protein
VADEGNCTFWCFGSRVGETKKHAVSPWFMISFVFFRVDETADFEGRMQRNCVFCMCWFGSALYKWNEKTHCLALIVDWLYAYDSLCHSKKWRTSAVELHILYMS